MFRRFKVEGHSMEPGLKSGSSVLVRKTKNVRVGDVIALRYSGRVMIKRVAEVRPEETIKVVGDNPSDSIDIPPISAREVIGRVVCTY